jgi:hypothetical protein
MPCIGGVTAAGENVGGAGDGKRQRQMASAKISKTRAASRCCGRRRSRTLSRVLQRRQLGSLVVGVSAAWRVGNQRVR